MTATVRLDAMLKTLDTRHRRRVLSPACGLDFASNDYLGLAQSQILRDAAQIAISRAVPLGSGGSRLLRGNHPEHEALEEEAAGFFGTEAALYMGGGFQANQAIFSTLPAAGDLVLHDALIHASAHEGLRLGRAETRAFAHNDISAAEAQIVEWRKTSAAGQLWIAVESVYSMEGDLAPLAALAALARRHDAVLVVDEAHATGIFGTNGRGLAHGLDAELLTLHTCGKGLGASGGLICGPRAMIETLINRARPFIFATAPAPFSAAILRAALGALQSTEGQNLTQAAQARIGFAHRAARAQGLQENALNSQIIPVVLGDDGRTMQAAEALQAQGFDIRGIRPPTVPRGTARLRISITGNVEDSDITALFAAIGALPEGLP